MNEKKSLNISKIILLVYCICFVFRFIEYFILRTDQGFFGEAFVHKLAGIAVLAITLHLIGYKWSDVGFKSVKVIKKICFGLFLGLVVFVVAYGAEIIINVANGNNPTLELYVTSYALGGNQGKSTSALLFIICIIGNIINVLMEEGIFRGLFQTLLKERNSFWKANIISSILFGVWHIAAPLRNYIDGEMSFTIMLINALILIAMTGVMGIKLGMLTELTGSLWAPMADHFVNNTIVNLLHVTTSTGADKLQMIRIPIAQTLSFVIVLVLYLNYRKQKVSMT